MIESFADMLERIGIDLDDTVKPGAIPGLILPEGCVITYRTLAEKVAELAGRKDWT